MGLQKNVKILKSYLLNNMSQKAKRKTIHTIEYWSSQIYSGRLPTTMVCGTMPFEKEFETFPPPEHCTSGIFRHMHPKPESLISHYITPSLEKSRIHYLFSTMHLPSLIFHYILFTGSFITIQTIPNNLQTISNQSRINPQNNLQTISKQSPNNLQTMSNQSQNNLKSISKQSQINPQTVSKQSPTNLKSIPKQSPNNLETISKQCASNLLINLQINVETIANQSQNNLKTTSNILSKQSI